MAGAKVLQRKPRKLVYVCLDSSKLLRMRVHDALCDVLIPDQWKLSNIVRVPKKVDLNKTDNFRGISLTSIVSKTLN